MRVRARVLLSILSHISLNGYVIVEVCCMEWLGTSNVSSAVVIALYVLLSLLASWCAIITSHSDPGTSVEALWGSLIEKETSLVLNGEAGPSLLNDCATCESSQPPRARHCNVCDSCVFRSDHHSVWLDNCIGALNMGPYVGTLIFFGALSVLCVTVFSLRAARLPFVSISSLVLLSIAGLSSAAMGVACLWRVGIVSLLLWSGATLDEIRRAPSPWSFRPHDRGLMRNARGALGPLRWNALLWGLSNVSHMQLEWFIPRLEEAKTQTDEENFENRDAGKPGTIETAESTVPSGSDVSWYEERSKKWHTNEGAFSFVQFSSEGEQSASRYG